MVKPRLSFPLLSVLVVSLSSCRLASAPAPDTTTASPGVVSGLGAKVIKVGSNPGHVDSAHAGGGATLAPDPGHQLAAFAEGCFWGSEDTFRHVPGVVATAVGFAGGHTKSPSYEDVCTHTTGHAETVLVEFDPVQVTYSSLLRVFWDSHDPTTLNRQGPDEGDQYRSAIFTFSPDEERDARASLQEEAKHYKSPITTQIQPMGAFWKAEEYHQQFDEKTGRHSCPMPARHST
jgi:peptide-methionine (S)-S-oxide reductase